MHPGIVVQHARLPARSAELVRCDIAGIIGFIPRHRWPEGATAGDFVEIVLRQEGDLWAHPDRALFDPASRRAVRGFFANGGDTAHLFGVCINTDDDLKVAASVLGVLAPLFDRLRAEEDIAILLVPGAAYMRCEWNARTGEVRADADVIYDQLLAHCREMTNRFLVMDAPQALHGEPLLRWARSVRDRDPATRSYGAVYYPWLFQGDELFPPSGVIAGTFARTELEHVPYGVAWPPANVPIQAVTHPEVELSWAEAGELAEESINPIVVQPGRGVLAFGSRTLSRVRNTMHINSRRVINMVTEQLRRDSEWAVFETNNPHLWDVLERDVLFRLREFATVGLLTGRQAGEDYSVKCDAETNLPALRDAGQVNMQIRMHPVGTVEQILIELCIGGETFSGGA